MEEYHTEALKLADDRLSLSLCVCVCLSLCVPTFLLLVSAFSMLACCQSNVASLLDVFVFVFPIRTSFFLLSFFSALLLLHTTSLLSEAVFSMLA